MLMEEEAKKADGNLAETVTKLALASKEADAILKQVKFFENKTMNNEVEIEEADKNLRETTKMASDNEQKLDELTRKLGVQEDELKRANERAELAESKYYLLININSNLDAYLKMFLKTMYKVVNTFLGSYGRMINHVRNC